MTLSDFLPATQPPLADVRSCNDWLASATLADPRQACATLLSLLEELEQAPAIHIEYMRILERLRKPLLGALLEHTKKFTAKPLPLGHAEALALHQTCRLWAVLTRSYRRLLRAGLKGEHPELAPFAPLLATRSIESAGGSIISQCLARQEITADQWQILHGAFALAETHGLINKPIGDRGLQASASTVYVQTLLISLAATRGLSAREFQWLRRWARRWSHKVSIARDPIDTSHFSVDLGGQCGPTWRNGKDAGVAIRFLDTSRVGRTLRKRIQRLELGENPALLGLGSDIVQPLAGELLATLLQSWCAAPQARKFPRRQSSTATVSREVDFAVGFAAAHASISGTEFVSEKKAWDYRRHTAESIQVFQHAESSASRSNNAPELKVRERWAPIDESAEGFKLRRTAPGSRVSVQQLVSLRPHGSKYFILAVIRWALQEQGSSIVVGAHAIPGLARACAVHQSHDDPLHSQPLTQAFLLPASDHLTESVVLPSGWYQRDGLLTLRDEHRAKPIRLSNPLARGFDYDWATFNTMG